MSILTLSQEKLDEIFECRYDETKKEWKKIKDNFLDAGIENLLKEKVDNLTFHVVYVQISGMSDEDVYDHLTEEL